MELWEQMTWIARGVVIALFLLSIWSLYVCIERLIWFSKAKKQSLEFARKVTQLLKQDKPSEAIDLSRKYRHSHLARVTRAGLTEFVYDTSQPAPEGHDMVEAAKRAIERETLVAYADFKKGVASLATIATTAPFIGLFGTVIGIINAFRGMAISSSGGIGAVSGGIAEALVTTALGLFVAIPAAWMFNHFTNALERIQVEMSNSSSELVDYFLRKRKQQETAHAAGVRV
jgi:biopolymer transport protein ExbB/biopolymer transport protein TolQ